MRKLQMPFDYYYKMFMECKCPFCGESLEYMFEHDDILHCSFYGGYVSDDQDSAFLDGECRNCNKHEGHRSIAEGSGFLCENCSHGVKFDEMIVFQVLFESHEEATCTHCEFHNSRMPTNPVTKPEN